MYGYANEILPYIMGLLQDNNTNLSSTTNSVAPTEEENSPVSKTAKRSAPRNNMAARPQRPQGLLGSSAPQPPRRPNFPVSAPPATNMLAGQAAYDPNYPAMRSNSPQDNLPKGPLNMTAGPSPYGDGSSIMNPFFAQYLYGNG